MNDRFHHLVITATDFDASLAFYRDVLGWDVNESWGDKNAGRGAALSGGGMRVIVTERSITGEGRDEGLAGARPNVHLDIHDIDARFAEIPKGAHVVKEPQETRWGTRWFVVRDPDGNLFAFEELHKRSR